MIAILSMALAEARAIYALVLGVHGQVNSRLFRRRRRVRAAGGFFLCFNHFLRNYS